MTTFMQWIHVMAAVIGLGGMGFILLILIPALGVLNPEQRETLYRAVSVRFRWVSWSVIGLLLISGLYSTREYYWEVTWGKSWVLLSIKIALAFALFGIVLGLSLPLPFAIFERMRARRRAWLIAAFALGVVVVLISAYLRRG
jgi:uncharacterized membrane protein